MPAIAACAAERRRCAKPGLRHVTDGRTAETRGQPASQSARQGTVSVLREGLCCTALLGQRLEECHANPSNRIARTEDDGVRDRHPPIVIPRHDGMVPGTRPIVFCPSNKIARMCLTFFQALPKQRAARVPAAHASLGRSPAAVDRPSQPLMQLVRSLS